MRLTLTLLALLALTLPAAEIVKSEPRVRAVCVDVQTPGDPQFSVEVVCDLTEAGKTIGAIRQPSVGLTLADFDAEQLAAYSAFKAALLAAVVTKQAAP